MTLFITLIQLFSYVQYRPYIYDSLQLKVWEENIRSNLLFMYIQASLLLYLHFFYI